MSNFEFYAICAVLLELPILLALRFFMAIWSINRIMGTRSKNGPASWIALAVLRSDVRDMMKDRGGR